jgi:hypothetical protein
MAMTIDSRASPAVMFWTAAASGGLRQARSLGQFQVRNDQPLHRVRGVGVLEANLVDRGHLPGRGSRAHAVRVGQRLE